MVINDDVFSLVNKEYSAFFSSLSRLDPLKLTNDTLSLSKPDNEIKIIKKYLRGEEIAGKKLLNIGSGFGIFNLIAIKNYNINAYGIEPNSKGFGNSYEISKQIFGDNGLSTETLLPAIGEKIPFNDGTFDIVYSTNVLEHVQNPMKVLDEGLRVLKPGGILQFVFPNYQSFFDGHYAVFHPPVLFKAFFPWYIKHIINRSSSYAKSLNTELNVRWAENAVKTLAEKYNIKLISLGEEVFFERITSNEFGTWAGLYKIKNIINVMKKFRINNWVSHILYYTKTWSPVILTIKKSEQK